MSEHIVFTGWGHITPPKDTNPRYLDPIDIMEAAAR
jgi:hypothetical protein